MSITGNIRIVDNRKNKLESIYCDVCNYPKMTGPDFVASEKYNCCHDCFLTFIESRKSNWKEGDRPKRKIVDSYIETKDKLCHKSRSIE